MKHFFIIPHFIEVVDIEHINIFQWYINVQFCSTWASKRYDTILLIFVAFIWFFWCFDVFSIVVCHFKQFSSSSHLISNIYSWNKKENEKLSYQSVKLLNIDSIRILLKNYSNIQINIPPRMELVHDEHLIVVLRQSLIFLQTPPILVGLFCT